MNGKYLYLAISALLGLLSTLVQFFPFFLCFLLYWLWLLKWKQFNKPQLLLILLVAVIFSITGEYAAAKNQTHIPESTTSFLVQFIQDPKIDGDLLQIQAEEQRYNEKILIRYQINSETEKSTLKSSSFYRGICSVSGTISKPRIVKNPNGFNYRGYLASKGVFWIVESPKNPFSHCTVVGTDPLKKIKELRYEGIRFLETSLPPEVASLSAALIFGDRSLFDAELQSDYQKTGIVHLLAISGLHVSLLVGMFFYFGIRIGLTREFMVHFLLFLLPVYVIITGGSPSVIRAVLMIFLVLAATKWKIRPKILAIDAISIAFLFYIFVDSYIIFDVGFQLSFSVSFSIILSSQYLLRAYQNYLAQMIVTSIIAQLAALPFLFYHYFEISFMGIAANLLYIPLFSFLYLPGLYFLFFVQILFGKPPDLLIHMFSNLINMSNKFISHLANFSFTSFIPGRPNPILLFCYFFTILLIFYIWECSKIQKKILFLFTLSITLLSFQYFWNWIQPVGQVTMIDVGQGDSILIQLPHRQGTYLIDTGGTIQFNEEAWRKRTKPFEVGRDVVVPYLKGQGITTIDKLILSHGDMDHMGGAFAVLEEIKVKEILLPDVSEPSESEIIVMRLAAEKNIPVVKVYEGMHWNKKGTQYYVLSPEQKFTGERNRGSIAIFAKIGGLSWFFGGDLDQEGEERIITKYPS
ncbi:DNA internalization-related competence protein ComEC/Rec2 [Neobacillus sp. LXY-1]|uniref:DNA internalization-related competence protein ComEC/Rec2 n=1 Tax=Neobacillus sp. LXY-1 TaxID=3379133 RepID=UPI003EE12CBE